MTLPEYFQNLPMPGNMTRQEILNLLLQEEYGEIPEKPVSVQLRKESCDLSFCAGKADLQKLWIDCELKDGQFSFPVSYVCPKKADQPIPCFILINFRPDVPDRYLPSEELADAGFAVLSFYYEDITTDNEDFTDGLAGLIYPDGKRNNKQCGKIGLWAYAALQVFQAALTLPEIDPDCISVVGHSRLGKTALLAGALEERFFCAFSNDSGCSGAALSRHKQGEQIADICQIFPYWFNKEYLKYVGKEEEQPFDQHYLIAANLPHYVYVASAEQDIWADPVNEYFSCLAASPFYEMAGRAGFVSGDSLPKPGTVLHMGEIGYHLRAGKHYLSREDWQQYISYILRHRN